MAQPRTTDAFVLRKVDYGDKDLIVTLLGRETGKFSAIARGARASKRRFGGGLQPMRCLALSYTLAANRDLAFLREIDVLEDFPALEADFDRITIASYFTELVREFAQEAHAEPKVFDILRSFYREIAEATASPLALEAVLHHFELALLEAHGALPSLDGCFRCGQPALTMDKIRCLRTGEGVICGECRRLGESAGVIERQTLDLLHYFHQPGLTAPTGLSDPSAIIQARRVIDTSFEHLLDRPLKSRPMLDTVLDGIFG